MGDGENLRFLIERKMKAFQQLPHLQKRLLKYVLAVMNQDAVIHVSGIVSDSQLFFDQPVKRVQVEQYKPLTCLVTHGDSLSGKHFVA